MAFSFTQTPVDYTPAYNPMIFAVTSSMTAQPNFRYKWVITVGTESTTIIQSPRPDFYALLDVHRIVESYLTTNIDFTTSDFARNTRSWTNYTVKCTESYGTPATDHTTITTAGSTKVAINASLTFHNFIGWNYTPYVIGSGNGALFLTNSPSTQNIIDGEHGWIHYYTTSTSDTNARKLRLSTLAADMTTVIATYDFTSPYSIATPYNFIRFPYGMDQLRLMNFPTDPFVGVAGYKLQILSVANAGMSEIKTFKIDTSCTIYEVVRLHFLNVLGGFDAYNFRMKSANNTEIQRSVFKRIPTLGDLATRGDVQFNTVTSDSVTAISDWVGDDEAIWLKELFTSPEVYLEDPASTYLEAVVIGNTSYETKNTATSRLFALTVQFSKAIDNTRQRF